LLLLYLVRFDVQLLRRVQLQRRRQCWQRRRKLLLMLALLSCG
jgi:hypothetical protein